VAWDKICLPKTKGGLGIHKSEAINQAFQCKLACCVLTKESSLWVQAMNDKYLRKSSLLDYSSKSTDSAVWRNVLRSRHLLRQGIRWNLGQGEKIRFWEDNWLADQNLLQLLNRSIHSVSLPDTKVSDFITANKRWDMFKLNQVIHDSTILRKILGLDIPISNMADLVCWGLHSSGEFSTKSATWLAHGTQLLSRQDWVYKWIWKLDIMPKLQIFLWQIFHNVTPIHGTLFRRGLNIDPTCPLCLEDIESLDHLF